MWGKIKYYTLTNYLITKKSHTVSSPTDRETHMIQSTALEGLWVTLWAGFHYPDWYNELWRNGNRLN